MKTPSEIPNNFKSFELSEEDAMEASKLSSLQKMHLHNLASEIAIELLNLDYKPEAPLDFVKAKYYRQGYIAAITYILAVSDAAEKLERGMRMN